MKPMGRIKKSHSCLDIESYDCAWKLPNGVHEIYQVPKGWVIVPLNPTEEMLLAIFKSTAVPDFDVAKKAWSKIVSSIPKDLP